jgi:hypothetical protein
LAEKFGEKMAFFYSNYVQLLFAKKNSMALFFAKNGNFSPKIVIVTSTPGHPERLQKLLLHTLALSVN